VLGLATVGDAYTMLLPTEVCALCQDISDPEHFGPKTFRHHQTGAKVSRGHFGTCTDLSRPPANIFLLQ